MSDNLHLDIDKRKIIELELGKNTTFAEISEIIKKEHFDIAIQKVLIEGRSKTNDNMLTGRSDSNKVVILEGCDELVGKMVEIKIVSEHMWYLKGEIV